MKILETLRGKKTYLTVAITLVVLVGQKAGLWDVPGVTYAGLAAAVVVFLRKGHKDDLANVVEKLSPTGQGETSQTGQGGSPGTARPTSLVDGSPGTARPTSLPLPMLM